MLLYVIPFILLLVIAIVLKKREDANKENASANTKKGNNKKTAKKSVAQSARTSQRQQSRVVQEEIVAQQITKPLSADLKSSIEKLIAEKNYFSAEAKINQALNQDNAQHELYLYLVDVHLAQKDELAVNQLLNHIRSLNLDDIYAKAEQKQKDAHVEAPIESIAFESSQPATPEVKNTAAFDALIGNTETTTQVPVTPVVEETQATNTTEAQPLEFNLNQSTPVATPVEQSKSETVAPLEFTFTPSETTPVEKPTEAEIAPEFKLDFTEPSSASVIEEVSPSNNVEFKLTQNEAEAQPTFNFELDNKAEPEVVAAPSFNFETTSSATSTAVNINDPLVKSFPELAEVNEIQLNLDLAKHYISLGAYTSARELIAQDEAAYTAEQRELSQKLLNQIAS